MQLGTDAARRVPNAITYNSWISACETGKQPERALSVFEAMVQQGVVPNEITYTPLINTSEAVKVFQAMLEQSMVSNIITCTTLISAYEKGKQPK